LIDSDWLSSHSALILSLQDQVLQQNSSSLTMLVFRASPIAKFVLLILLIFSVVSWAIIFSKSRSTKKIRQQNEEFFKIFEQSNRWAEIYSRTTSLNESPLRNVFLAANKELQKQTILNLDAVGRSMQSAAITETTKLEKNLGWLASTASASPFIGLFGTVVGIIIAFQGLSQAATASIQAVAPGIAEALIATAAGIAAAVPAVLAYNHFLNIVRTLAAEMDSFSMNLLNFIEREAASTQVSTMN
jgi:biopolymer transport protein TolQ